MKKRLGWRFNHRHNISDWIEHRADGLRYARRVLVTRPQNLIGYWPQWEGNGAVSFDNSPQGNDGVYTGVTLAQPGIGDGRYSPFFDGANDYNDIYSVALAAIFNPNTLTMLTWVRVLNAAIWGAGTRYAVQMGADANNRVALLQNAANMEAFYIAGGVVQSNTVVAGPRVDYFPVACTVDTVAGELEIYMDGIPTGVPVGGLGVWVGGLTEDRTNIGASRETPAALWHGWIGPTFLYDVVLTQPEIAFLSESLRM